MNDLKGSLRGKSIISQGGISVKFIIEMNVHELSRSISAGTLAALAEDIKSHEDQVRNGVKYKQEKKVETKNIPKKEEPKKEDSTEKPETKQTALTIEDVRALFVEKNNVKGNTAKLKAILTEFEVKKVTDLEEKNFRDVMARLKEL